MAKKRMLDSEIWHDRKVVKLSNDAFILWVAIISMADDEGVFEYDPDAWFYEIARKDLTSEKIKAAMNEIIEQRMIIMYGDVYGFIPAWFKHQNLSHPTLTKNRRPPRDIVEQYPEYIAAWMKTFTTYRKGPDEKREIITPEYPYPEGPENTAKSFSSIPEHSGIFRNVPATIDKIRSDQVRLNQISKDEVRQGEGETSASEPVSLSPSRELLFAWYKNFAKETAITTQPSEDDVKAAIEAMKQLQNDVSAGLKANAYYWEHWRDLWFAYKSSDKQKPQGQRRPDYSFRAFARNITSCLVIEKTLEVINDPL